MLRISLSIHSIACLLLAVILALALALETAKAQSVPPNAAPGISLKQRIAQRKAEVKVRLDQKSAKRLQTTCKNGQAKIRIFRNDSNTIINNREEVYRKIDAKLWVMVGGLKLINQDTFTLEKQRSDLSRRIVTFENTANQFQQTLDDLIAINCQADVVGFSALLETSRKYFAALSIQSTGIKNFTIDSVKKTLAAHSEALKPKTNTEQ